MTNKLNSDLVPIKNTPDNVRIKRLSDAFYSEFACKPMFFVRVPGRVNLIGEHIDYCGYPVLPMALQQDILIAARQIEELELHLTNTNKKYPKYDCKINSYQNITILPGEDGKPSWYNYVLCGVKGALECLDNKIISGLQLLIDGNIPPASGLSSSSALVSASCLSFLYAQNATLRKAEIAALCARSERYIGTQGGGMDQAIGFLAEKYSAQYITFQPLNATPVALPEEAVFVVANSVAEANKAATNDFNTRVVECRLAAKMLVRKANILADKKIITLCEVQHLLNKNLKQMADIVLEYLPKDIYQKTEVCKSLQMTEKELNESYLTPNTIHVTEFKLKQRALHVYQEAARVEDFKSICSQYSSNGNGDAVNEKNDSEIVSHSSKPNTFQTLGDLMSNSHESLKNLYECSHSNLDLLVDISKKYDVPARLTGAGWGGCVVAICRKEYVDNYIQKLIEEFYQRQCKISSSEAHEYVFATTPNHGAMIFVDKL